MSTSSEKALDSRDVGAILATAVSVSSGKPPKLADATKKYQTFFRKKGWTILELRHAMDLWAEKSKAQEFVPWPEPEHIEHFRPERRQASVLRCEECIDGWLTMDEDGDPLPTSNWRDAGGPLLGDDGEPVIDPETGEPMQRPEPETGGPGVRTLQPCANCNPIYSRHKSGRYDPFVLGRQDWLPDGVRKLKEDMLATVTKRMEE